MLHTSPVLRPWQWPLYSNVFSCMHPKTCKSEVYKMFYMANKKLNLPEVHFKAIWLAQCQKNGTSFHSKKPWWCVGSLPDSSNLSLLWQICSRRLLWTRPNHLSLAFPAFILNNIECAAPTMSSNPTVFPGRPRPKRSSPYCLLHDSLTCIDKNQ